MNEQMSEMDKQQDTPLASLVITLEKNRGKRNACAFLGIVVLAVVWVFSWSNWFLLIPAALGIGAFLSQINVVIVSSKLKRR